MASRILLSSCQNQSGQFMFDKQFCIKTNLNIYQENMTTKRTICCDVNVIAGKLD